MGVHVCVCMCVCVYLLELGVRLPETEEDEQLDEVQDEGELGGLGGEALDVSDSELEEQVTVGVWVGLGWVVSCLDRLGEVG